MNPTAILDLIPATSICHRQIAEHYNSVNKYSACAYVHKCPTTPTSNHLLLHLTQYFVKAERFKLHSIGLVKFAVEFDPVTRTAICNNGCSLSVKSLQAAMPKKMPSAVVTVICPITQLSPYHMNLLVLMHTINISLHRKGDCSIELTTSHRLSGL